MLSSLRRNPVSTAALALSALAVATSAPTFADAASSLINGSKIKARTVKTKQLAPSAVTASRLAPNSVRSSHVLNGSLTKADLAPGTIPSIPAPLDAFTKGESDARYLTPAAGDGRYLTPAAGDGRYLAAGGKAADAETLDGTDSDAFALRSEVRPTTIADANTGGNTDVLTTTHQSIVSHEPGTSLARYLVAAKAQVDASQGSLGAECELRLGAEVLDTVIMSGTDGREQIALMGVGLRNPGETAALFCRKHDNGGPAFVDRATIVALKGDGLD